MGVLCWRRPEVVHEADGEAESCECCSDDDIDLVKREINFQGTSSIMLVLLAVLIASPLLEAAPTVPYQLLKIKSFQKEDAKPLTMHYSENRRKRAIGGLISAFKLMFQTWQLKSVEERKLPLASQYTSWSQHWLHIQMLTRFLGH